MTNETTPASSLTDKEREAIAQMPYEEARDQLIQAVQALEAGGKAVRDLVHLRGLLALTGNDQRCTCLVDQD